MRALRAYLERPDEETRHAAYCLGRRALAEGVGLLDMVTLLDESFREVMDVARGRDPRAHQAARGFLTEYLSPFEMTLRGAREGNAALRHQNQVLEDEAKRIAHALHDTAGQLLASVHVELDLAAQMAPPALLPPLRRIHRLLNEVEENLRGLSHELRPTILEDLGLLPALRFLAQGIERRTGLAVIVDGSTSGRLPAEIETALYRVVQEALTNAAKHAHASRVDVRIEREEAEVRCCVEDDGVGFDFDPVNSSVKGQGLGLIGIRERVGLFGGTLWCSAAGSASARRVGGAGVRGGRHGACVLVTIPLERTHAAATASC